VTFPASQRSGILTQPSFLSAFSEPENTDPIRRGKFIAQSLLCLGLPEQPPTAVPPLPETPNATMREKLSVHANAAPACRACHDIMDPLGLGLEGYDDTGRFRTTEKNRPVDTRGAITGTFEIDGPFEGALELSCKLASSETVQRCLVRHGFRFWMGRNETDVDNCSLRSAVEAARASGGDLRRPDGGAVRIGLVPGPALELRSMHMNATSRLSRRSFLERLSLGAGAVVLAPLVHAVQAHAAGSPLSRKRFLLVTFCNGMEYKTFAPAEYRGKTMFSSELVNTSTFTWPEKLAALAKWRERSLLIDGLVNQQNGGGHLSGYDIACVPKGGSGETGTPGGQTFDQYLSDRIGRGAAIPSIAVGANTTSGGFNIASTSSREGIFARGKGQPVTIQMSPIDSYKFVFGGGGGGDNTTGLDLKAALARRKTLLLDFVGEDVKRLRAALAGSEKQKLDEYVSSLDELQRRVESFATVDGGRCGDPSPSARRYPEEEFVVQADLTAAALACGLTNVASLHSWVWATPGRRSSPPWMSASMASVMARAARQRRRTSSSPSSRSRSPGSSRGSRPCGKGTER
jgi:hypothetical protein